MLETSVRLLPVLPAWLVLLLAAALLGVLAHGCVILLRRQVPPRWVLILAILRIGIVLLFALILLHPVVSYSHQTERRPAMLILLDISESMAQPGAAEGSTRLEEVLQALDKGGLTAGLERHHQLRWFAFDRGALPLQGREWTGLHADGSATHYADSLTQAWNHVRASSGATPERVLLVSDGLDRGSPDVVEVARRLGVVIDVLAPGSPPADHAPAPVTVADVQGARRVLLGSETHFLVTLHADHTAADRTVKVRLLEGGKELESATAVLRGGRTEERVRLVHRPAETGTRRYEFRADDSDPFPLSVQVTDGKHEVLVLEDTWRWEFKFLRRALEDDPSFRFTGLLSRGGGAFMQFAAPDRRAQLVGFPQNQAQLAAFDTVIVGDVDPRRWPRDLAPSLRRLIADEGKSLVVLAGPNLAHWTAAPDLLTLLPVEITRETAAPVAGPVPVRVTADGARSPFFLVQQGTGTAALTDLPALDQVYPPLRKKPAATVLLEAAKLGNSFGPLIVMAEHTVGRGRVLYVGTDTLWKWQTLTPAADPNTTPYHLFWQQTLRALAPTRPGGTGTDLWLQPGRSRYESGQRAVVRADIESAAPLTQPALRGVVSLPNGRTLPLGFTADPVTPNVYTAEFETGPAGSYRLTGSVISEGRTVAESSAVLDVAGPKPERDGAPVDVANLARIATATGGKVIDPGAPETWPTSTTGPAVVAERVTLDLVNRAYLLILLTLLAGTDWMLRLLRGYV